MHLSRSAFRQPPSPPARRRVPNVRTPWPLLLILALLTTACGPSTFPQRGPKPLPAATVPADRDEAARQFVLGFLEARQAGAREEAEAFLSSQAREQFAAGEGGLRLVGGIDSLALLALEAADADSYEALVRVETTAGGEWEEYLFVGPGPAAGDEAPRPWIVRGALVRDPSADG